jgi:hypothetical protein
MKRFSMALALLAMSACAGLNARQDGMRVVADAYATIVQPIVLVGIGAEQDAGRISAAKAEELRVVVRTIGVVLDGGTVADAGGLPAAWDMLLPFALQGIDARIAKGEIGPGVGEALKETIRLFGARLVQIAGRA